MRSNVVRCSACQSESSLSYNQHKPPSRIKELIDQDKKMYRNQKQRQEQDENVLNTANFTCKATSSLMSQPLSQQKLIQSKQNQRVVNSEDDQYTKSNPIPS